MTLLINYWKNMTRNFKSRINANLYILYLRLKNFIFSGESFLSRNYSLTFDKESEKYLVNKINKKYKNNGMGR